MKKITFITLISALLIGCYSTNPCVNTENGVYYLSHTLTFKTQYITINNGSIVIYSNYNDSIFTYTIGDYKMSLFNDTLIASYKKVIKNNITLSDTSIIDMKCCYRYTGDTLIKSNMITGYQYYIKESK